MKNNFDVKDILSSIIGYKGLPYPGVWLPTMNRRGRSDDYQYSGDGPHLKQYSDLGSVLRKMDAQGRWWFLPVVFEHKGTEYEIPNAVISISAKKTIVETAMVGRKGTVKELISVDDYEIHIVGTSIDTDFPESQIAQLNELFNINEAITLKCALTDIFLAEEDKVVIKSIDFAEMKGTETAQQVTINLVSDCNFDLILS